MNGKLFTAFRGQPEVPGPANEFTGKDYYARFSSSAPIILDSVAFYGRKLTDNEYIQKYAPGNKKSNEPVLPKWALLILEICQSRLHYPKLRAENRQVFMERMAIEVNVLECTNGDVFFVQLPSDISIPANIIFDFAFRLYGLDESLRFYGLAKEDNRSKVIPVVGCDVHIQVHRSSTQCAGFGFRLNEHVTRLPEPETPLKMSTMQSKVPVMNASFMPVPMKKGRSKRKSMKFLASCFGFFDNFPN